MGAFGRALSTKDVGLGHVLSAKGRVSGCVSSALKNITSVKGYSAVFFLPKAGGKEIHSLSLPKVGAFSSVLSAKVGNPVLSSTDRNMKPFQLFQRWEHSGTFSV